jgi:hypothetical protein
MKRNILPFISSIIVLTVLLTSCQAIGEIFKAGMWSGIIIVVVIIGLILYFISRAGKGSQQ